MSIIQYYCEAVDACLLSFQVSTDRSRFGGADKASNTAARHKTGRPALVIDGRNDVADDHEREAA